MNLTYQIEDKQKCNIIALNGDCFKDGADREFFQEAEMFVNTQAPNVIFDLKKLRHLNSSGINIFVRVLKLVNEKGGKLVFINVPESVQELLNIIKLNSIFNIENDLKEGMKCLNA